MKLICRLLAVALLLGATPVGRGAMVNGIVAVVHDAVITSDELGTLNAQTEDLLRRLYRSQPDIFEQKMNETSRTNLNMLRDRQLILHEFKTAGYSLPESVIDDLVKERIRSRFGDRVTLTKTLQAQGMTVEKFREQVRENFIVEALRAKNISSEIIISPHKVETYYQDHREDFKLEDEVKLRMIVLNKSTDPAAPSAAKLAEDILKKLKEGASFAEMATVYSQGSQRNQGGDWGWVERSVLRKELVDAAFSLKPGQLSGVIETTEACYVMLVEDVRPSHFKTLAEVRGQIEKSLLLDERKRLESQWIERLRKKTFVAYF